MRHRPIAVDVGAQGGIGSWQHLSRTRVDEVDTCVQRLQELELATQRHTCGTENRGTEEIESTMISARQHGVRVAPHQERGRREFARRLVPMTVDEVRTQRWQVIAIRKQDDRLGRSTSARTRSRGGPVVPTGMRRSAGSRTSTGRRTSRAPVRSQRRRRPRAYTSQRACGRTDRGSRGSRPRGTAVERRQRSQT